MKICLFTENHYKGGLDTFLINLVNAWPVGDDELTLVCNGSHPGLKSIANAARRPLTIKTYYRVFTSNIAQGLSANKLSRFILVRILFVLTFRVLQYPIIFPWYVFTLMHLFRRTDFDRLMVVNGGYPASLLCRCAVIGWRLAGKRPLATLNFHSTASVAPWYFRCFENVIDRWVVSSVSHIVSVSKTSLGSLSNRIAFRNFIKMSYIYNGIEDPTPFFVADSAKNIRVGPSTPYCLMLATYHSYKGHSFLFKAFRFVLERFPEVRLLVYGDGYPHERRVVNDELRRQKLEDHITLGGFTSQTATLFAGASVLVVPSQAYESFGLTIVEAMAFRVPVVTTDVGGMPEVLGDSNGGYVCSRNDPLEFAEAIMRILGNPLLAAQLGRNGRLAFEAKFTSSAMARQYNSVLKNETN
jgi:glycosyltransferase involved in cell wall biosynthesis